MNLPLTVPFLIYLVIMLFIGLWSNRIQNQNLSAGSSFVNEYFVAGRGLGPWLLAFSFLATFASAGTFIGYPGLAYKNGMTIIMSGINQIACVFFAMGLIGKRIAQIGRRVDAITITDILYSRFKHPLTIIGASGATIIFYIGFMVAQSAGGARVVQAVTGMSYQTSLTLVLLVVVFYTAIGGLRAVATTDLVQGLMMLLGVMIVFPVFIKVGGGFNALTTGLHSIDPGLTFGPGVNNSMPFSLLISYWILWVWMGVGMPATTVRLLSFKDSKSLKYAILLGTIGATIIYVPMFYMASTARFLFPDLPADLAMPTLYIKILPPWIAGIALAAPFAAIMSTADSVLLVAASTFTKDLYSRFVNPAATPKFLGNLGIAATIIIGLASYAIAFNPPELLIWWVQFGSAGLLSALFVPVVAALYWKRATTWGGIASLFGGFFTYLILDIYYKNPLDILSFMWALLVSAILMVSVSYATKPQEINVLRVFFGKPSVASQNNAPPNITQNLAPAGVNE